MGIKIYLKSWLEGPFKFSYIYIGMVAGSAGGEVVA